MLSLNPNPEIIEEYNRCQWSADLSAIKQFKGWTNRRLARKLGITKTKLKKLLNAEIPLSDSLKRRIGLLLYGDAWEMAVEEGERLYKGLSKHRLKLS